MPNAFAAAASVGASPDFFTADEIPRIRERYENTRFGSVVRRSVEQKVRAAPHAWRELASLPPGEVSDADILKHFRRNEGRNIDWGVVSLYAVMMEDGDLLVMLCAIEGKPGSEHLAGSGLPLSVFYPVRGKLVSRNDWSTDALQFTLDARPDAFLILGMDAALAPGRRKLRERLGGGNLRSPGPRLAAGLQSGLAARRTFRQ